jgi:hypothetical protein
MTAPAGIGAGPDLTQLLDGISVLSRRRARRQAEMLFAWISASAW